MDEARDICELNCSFLTLFRSPFLSVFISIFLLLREETFGGNWYSSVFSFYGQSFHFLKRENWKFFTICIKFG